MKSGIIEKFILAIIALVVGYFGNRLVSSIDDLNIKVAQVLERTAWQGEAIKEQNNEMKEHDRRIRALEIQR